MVDANDIKQDIVRFIAVGDVMGRTCAQEGRLMLRILYLRTPAGTLIDKEVQCINLDEFISNV